MSTKAEQKTTLKHIENQVCGNLSDLEQELDSFIKLVQSSFGFFDLRFLKVVKKNNRAYFCYGTIVSEVPLKIIEEAKKNGNL